MKHTKKTPHPIIHPDVAHAQMEENSLIRFNEDSRPMFSPIPRNHSPDAEGDDSPRPMSGRGARDKTAFPSIHVDKCEKTQRPSYASASPEPACRSPDSDMEVDNEVMSTSHSSSGLNVPSPYMHRKSDGRVVLVTQDSNSGMLSSWSRSEGNLPDAVRRSHSTPGSHTQLLDINRYRPDWHPRPTLRQSSDVALHELRREGQRSPATPRRLTAHLLEPLSLNPGERSVSASHLQSP
ncbi:hypothetical protein V1264_022301 [Littorina saxatilis]|uniref:Uncharacterized protein n=1 Tax=Littorina saxatilis TaxID=31220 RepID=A0AAN9AK83_9CAEN